MRQMSYSQLIRPLHSPDSSPPRAAQCPERGIFCEEKEMPHGHSDRLTFRLLERSYFYISYIANTCLFNTYTLDKVIGSHYMYAYLYVNTETVRSISLYK